MAFFLDNLLEEIDKGISRPCILRRLLDGSEKQPISQVDIKSICLTMVSAGLDTIPAVLCAFVGHMSLPHGRECQERAYQELCDVFPDGTAWDRLVEEPQFRYLRALVKETLRVSTMPISLPRQTVKEITLRNGVVIPPKTVLLLNSYAANFDPNHYSNPDAFDPTRYLDSQGDHDLPHFSFGAGMRMCAGAHLVNRELLIACSRLILAFRILPSVHDRHLFVSDPQEIYKRPSVMVMPVPEFRVRLVPRDRSLLRQWLTRD
jgi:phenylacetate 2-hydroxylase